MSSEIIYHSAGMAKEIWERVDAETVAQRRSRGAVLEIILREHFQMPWVAQEQEAKHAS